MTPKTLVSWSCVVLALVAAGCGKPSSDQPAPGAASKAGSQAPELIQITKYRNTTLSDGDAETILGGVNSILQGVDSADDVSCPLNLKRKGSVSSFVPSFDLPSGVVDTQSKFNAVCQQEGLVHIVSQLTWCEGVGFNILGCSPSPTCIIVVRPSTDKEATLWAHEFGHTRGLVHRNEPNALMKYLIGQGNRVLNTQEVAHFLNPTSPLISFVGAHAGTVEEFVRQEYIHGLPTQEAKTYKSSANVGKLIAMLRSERPQVQANIVATLGVIGDDSAFDALTSFVSQTSGQLSEPDYRAKTVAVAALGLLLHNLPSQSKFRVLTFLKARASESQWQSLDWEAPPGESKSDRNQLLASMAIQALGTSGDRGAAAFLNTMHVQGDVIDKKVKVLQETIGEAIKLNRNVQKGVDILAPSRQ